MHPHTRSVGIVCPSGSVVSLPDFRRPLKRVVLHILVCQSACHVTGRIHHSAQLIGFPGIRIFKYAGGCRLGLYLVDVAVVGIDSPSGVLHTPISRRGVGDGQPVLCIIVKAFRQVVFRVDVKSKFPQWHVQPSRWLFAIIAYSLFVEQNFALAFLTILFVPASVK